MTPTRRPWTDDEMSIIRDRARLILYGATYYSQCKLLKTGVFQHRSWESIRNKLIRAVRALKAR